MFGSFSKDEEKKKKEKKKKKNEKKREKKWGVEECKWQIMTKNKKWYIYIYIFF